VEGVWATKTEGVGLIIHEISFQHVQPMWSWSTNVTDRQTGKNWTKKVKSALKCTHPQYET